MLHDIIQQNFAGFSVAALLILFILTNNNFERKTNFWFLMSAICVLVLIIEEAWEAQLALQPTLHALRVPLSALGYSLRPLIAYFLVVIIRRNDRKWAILMSIPHTINTLVAFSALFGPWAFWYTPDNEFMRGPLNFIPFVAALFYILTLLFAAMRPREKGGLIEGMTISVTVLLTIVATIMQSFFQFHAIQSACSGISITFYYLFLHTNQNNRDPLTGALTRRRFYLDAEKYRTTLTAVISLDLNDLKTLNDKYGHTEGDRALITITDVIRRTIRKNAALYRTGGDEFMILCYKTNEEKVKALIALLQTELGKTVYRCAIGYAVYRFEQGLDHVCQIADSAMYESKQRMKQQASEPPYPVRPSAK